MIKINKNGLTYYQFEIFTKFNIKHAVFTRLGGVSPTPFNSLNLGSTTGDSNKNVAANRELIFDCMELPVTSIYDVWQVHGNEIIYAIKPRKLGEDHIPADGIVTDKMGVTLFMRFADCVPILLFDPKKRIIGLVHAGWQGTVKRIVQRAIKTMEKEFNVAVQDVVAGIGPSICAEHYQVGENVLEKVNKFLPEIKEKIIYNRDNSTFFDLWKTNALLLTQIGVKTIEQSNFCTAENTGEWYSHRSEGAKSGRFAALISLD